MLKEAGSQEAEESEVGAAEHTIDSLNIQASPLVFRDTLVSSNPLNLSLVSDGCFKH